MHPSAIICPNCRHPFEPTAAMSAEIEDRLRLQFQARADADRARAEQRERAAADAEAAAKAQLAATQQRLREVDSIVAQRVAAEKAALSETIRKQARTEAALEAAAQLKASHEDSASLRAKLAAAQRAELDLLREKQQLEDARRQLELDKQRAIDAARKEIIEKAQRDASEAVRLNNLEHEVHAAALKRKVEELTHKLDQGSQQLQGEVLELDLEATLRLAFPRDLIEPVPKGVFGGDVLHRVLDPLGATAGIILWECKRTKLWSDGWLAKLRADRREAQAHVAVLMSTTLPRCTQTFQQIDSIWVCSEACAIPLASAIREGLIAVAAARRALEGKQTKVELLYDYVSGPIFRERVEAIAEMVNTLRTDLETEKKAMCRIWAKREKQLDIVGLHNSGLYGTFQGILGKSLPEIQSLSLPAGDAPDDRD